MCPGCRMPVISKCGDINIWHWAHERDADCDAWSEGETWWHKEWKDFFSAEEQEVVVGNHRADIKTHRGRVIELQHSPISPLEIQEREEFYGPGMVWVVDASDFIENIDFRLKYSALDSRKLLGHLFVWKWARKTWRSAKRPVFLDPGQDSRWSGNLFHIKSYNFKYPSTGLGTWGSKWHFLEFFGLQLMTSSEVRSALESLGISTASCLPENNGSGVSP